MEPHRAWNNPLIEILSTAVVDGGALFTAEAYDIANRRWYHIHVREATTAEPTWLIALLTKRLQAWFDGHDGTAPTWNTLVTYADDETQFVTQTRAAASVGREIRRAMVYGDGRHDVLPTTSVGELRQLTYLCRSADWCVWRQQACVFKRIEFDDHVSLIAAEIDARETAQRAVLAEGALLVDLHQAMMRRVCLVPILAVIIATRGPWPRGTVAGILTPYVGRDLEMLARECEAQRSSGGGGEGLPLVLEQLRNLTRGMARLKKAGVVHGDVRCWNTILQIGNDGDPTRGRLVLIDAGIVAPGYEGDAPALGAMLLWCMRQTRRLRENRDYKTMVVAAMCALMEGDYIGALNCLSTRK